MSSNRESSRSRPSSVEMEEGSESGGEGVAERAGEREVAAAPSPPAPREAAPSPFPHTRRIGTERGWRGGLNP